MLPQNDLRYSIVLRDSWIYNGLCASLQAPHPYTYLVLLVDIKASSIALLCPFLPNALDTAQLLAHIL
jgi:hypothetical protein